MFSFPGGNDLTFSPAQQPLPRSPKDQPHAGHRAWRCTCLHFPWPPATSRKAREDKLGLRKGFVPETVHLSFVLSLCLLYLRVCL